MVPESESIVSSVELLSTRPFMKILCGGVWHRTGSTVFRYHTIFWLDYSCSDSAEGFSVPAPFTVSEPEMDDVLPERAYTRQELQTYLD